jgi:hypothetical protein
MNRPTLIGIVAFFILSAGLLAGSAFSVHKTQQQRKLWESHSGWVRTDGVLRDCSYSYYDNRERYYTAQLQWTTPNGGTYSSRLVASYAYTCGEHMPIRYNPANPAESDSVNPPGGYWLVTALLAFMGLAFGGIAARVSLQILRAKREASAT